MDNNREYDDMKEQNDEFTGQSTRHSDIENTDNYSDNNSEDYEDLEDKWYEIEDQYREQYPDVTDEDVNVKPGRFDKTLERISQRIGRTRREIRTEIENW